jgi:hypothetical protein
VFDHARVFAPSHFDRPPDDGLNIGRVFSSPSGVTYSVSMQSPASGLGGAADREIGNNVVLQQFQNFRKDAGDARLRFTVTDVEIEAVDHSGGPPVRPHECPATELTCQGTMEGEVGLSVSAYPTDAPQQAPFYRVSGGALLSGFRGSFRGDLLMDMSATDPFWQPNHFKFRKQRAASSVPVVDCSLGAQGVAQVRGGHLVGSRRCGVHARDRGVRENLRSPAGQR